MDSALLVHRLHFAFPVTFHYLFPQLTMGLAPLIVVLKTFGLRRNDETITRPAAFLLWRGKLFSSRWMLWILLLALPFPTSRIPPGGSPQRSDASPGWSMA